MLSTIVTSSITIIKCIITMIIIKRIIIQADAKSCNSA